MKRKFILLMVMTLLTTVIHSKDKINFKSVQPDGSEIGKINPDFRDKPLYTKDNFPQQITNSYTVTYTPLGVSSQYDLQSNGSANEIWQNPVAPDMIHIATMIMPAFGSTRYVNYCLSTDRGESWVDLGYVTQAQSGFPSIDGFSDNGCAVISMHSTSGGLPAARTQIFIDQGPGFNIFDRLDAGLNGTVSMVWGRVITTGLSTNPSKFVNFSSENAGTMLAGVIRYNSDPPPGTFGPWNNYTVGNAEQYSLALGEDGRIGLAYLLPGKADPGAVAFRESSNGGLTFGSPVTIFDPDLTADSLGAFRGISMIYVNNSPCIVYELDCMSPSYNLNPAKPSFIMYWNPEVNGGIPKKIAGPENITFYPDLSPAGRNGSFAPLCRPVIGKTNVSGNQMIYVAFNASTSQSSFDSSKYYATYFIHSPNRGETWGFFGNAAPERITPETPVRDYRYVSISHTNSFGTGFSGERVFMVVEVHDYAGVYSPSQPPGPCEFLAMKLQFNIVNVHTINSSVPEQFSLHQNYPNPFNPSTSIRFDMKKAERVTLNVYNGTGQLVKTLIDDESVAAGTKEVQFNASDLASGIYFYTISAGNFIETKKMILMK